MLKISLLIASMFGLVAAPALLISPVEAGYRIRDSAFGGYNIQHDSGASTRCRPSAFGGYNCN